MQFTSHSRRSIFILFAFTIAIAGAIVITPPELKTIYKNATLRTINKITNVFRVESESNTLPSATITEFGTNTEVAIISNNSSSTEAFGYPKGYATTSEDTELVADTLAPFTPSPESVWASLYFNILGITQDDLTLDIGKVKEWQQTGGLARDLRVNSKGTDVKLMQYLLSKFEPSFPSSFATGNFGAKTKEALIKLQKRLGIKATGEFTDETKFFFDSVYYKELCPDADTEQDRSYENVGRRISVPHDYIPNDLIRIPRAARTVGVMCLSREPSMRLVNMFERASAEGQDLAVISAYRSAKTQARLTQYYLNTVGTSGLAGVAEAGHSEHQLGTTVDLSGKSQNYSGPNDNFGETPEGKWLAENSYKFGFIMSYPEGRQKDTGYIHEPWHFRYVGVDVAKDIHDEKMTIQEYFNLVTGNSSTTLEIEPAQGE